MDHEELSIHSPDGEEYQYEQVDTTRIRVPKGWCGKSSRNSAGGLVWTCGACRSPTHCSINRLCMRARDEDFK